MKMLNRYVEQTLKHFPNVDSIMIVDDQTIIQYYYTKYPNISSLDADELLGRKLLDAYPDLKKKDSYILRCLETEKSFMNYEQTFTSYLGTTLRVVGSAVPIHSNGKVVAVADLSIYPDKAVEDQDIHIEVPTNQDSGTDDTYDFEDIITQNSAMENIKQSIKSSSDSDAAVLVYGKTGTGKELIVNAIHKCSSREKGPLITQNCASIPTALLESLLFGTTKGSFTGADNKIGLFEMAHKGTLFLDEINSMELESQAKILRAIEEKKIRRVGDKEERNVDVRIIAAMNEDPAVCIRDNKIREDLYYRLSVIRYDLPELKDRLEDLPLLIDYFIKKYNKKYSKNIIGCSEKVNQLFLNYTWPGNVRELKNVIESAYHVNYSNRIDIENIPKHILNRIDMSNLVISESNGKPLDELVNEFERKLILSQYIANEKKLSQTARKLQISKQSLRYKLIKHGINS